jgi:hypothetical protein
MLSELEDIVQPIIAEKKIKTSEVGSAAVYNVDHSLQCITIS